MRKSVLLAAAWLALAIAWSAPVARIGDDVPPKWAEYLRSIDMTGFVVEWAPKISMLISGSAKPVSNAEYILHVVPEEKVTKDTAPAFCGGSQIWFNSKWLKDVGDNIYEVKGCCVHELTHAVQGTVGDYWGRPIDLGNTMVVFPSKNGGRPVREALTEGLADWTRRFFFATYQDQEGRRFDLLNRGVAIVDFGQGPDFLDYLNRRFGPKIVPKILVYCSKHGGDKIRKMWPLLTGRTYPQLLSDWRNQERIDDPCVRWTYGDGMAGGSRAEDRSLSLVFGDCFDGWNGWKMEDAGDRTGARIMETGWGRLKREMSAGEWTVAMRAKIATDRSRKGVRGICSIGNIEDDGEKELVFAAVSGKGMTAIMAVNDGGQRVASSCKVASASVLSAGYFTLVATAVGGTNLSVRVDGAPVGNVDLNRKCHGARFGAGLQLGGMFGQVQGGSRLAEAGIVPFGGKDDIRFADFRFFRRALKESEIQMYEKSFR